MPFMIFEHGKFDVVLKRAQSTPTPSTRMVDLDLSLTFKACIYTTEEAELHPDLEQNYPPSDLEIRD